MQNSNERGRRGRAKGTPGYLRHRDRKRGDRAFVLLDGKRIYLGQWNSPESRVAYDREIAAWLARGRAAPPTKTEAKPEGRKVVEIIEAFWKHAQEHYRHEDGTPTGETDRIIQYALRPVRLLFADQPAKEFGPACLETVRNHMIEEGLARSVINQRIGVVKRMFRWAERKEMVPRGTFHNLATLEALKAGRSRARETAEVEPVSWEHVAATLDFLPPSVRAMVQVQQLTGMRPGEVVTMRTVDIDRSEPDWIYRPPQHKTKHRGIAREVPLLEKVQAILKPLIEQKTEFLFVPEGRIARAKRYTTTTYAQAIRRGAAAASAPERHEAILATIPADVRKFFEKQVRRLWKHMSPKRLARVIERIAKRKKLAPGPLVDKAVAALEKHVDKVPAWSPNQLRHAAATRIVNNSRLEDARVVLGHTDMRTTLRYVKPDLKRAIDAMRKLG